MTTHGKRNRTPYRITHEKALTQSQLKAIVKMIDLLNGNNKENENGGRPIDK